MIRLNMTSAPNWLTLAPGLRVQVAPLTTALMVSARADPAIETLPETATREELALAMAKAIARRAVLDWKGVGDEAGKALPISPEGIDALLEIWPIFEAFQTLYVAKGLILDAEKTSPRPCRMVLRRGRKLLRRLFRALPRLSGKTKPATHLRGLAGLGLGRSAWWAVAGSPRCSARLGHGGRAGNGAGHWDQYADRRRAVARDRGRDGAQGE